MAYRKVDKGDRVSEYILVERLGIGGFGEVWKAEHAQIPGKFVAIKIPTRPDCMDLLKKEAVFQHQLDHPNIVKTIGLNTQHDPPYFMMEYVEGKNLRQLMMEDGILPPPYAIDIAVQVLEGLAYAHSRNIVHKDVKPENILVEKKKINVADRGKALLHYVKLTDLGLGMLPGHADGSIVVSDVARTSGVRMLSGTLFYMSPEQMVPGRTVDARADIYGMGVVLYEMLTGELPLGMDLPSELNPVVTPELDAICKKALSIDRDMRYQTVREMAEDLHRAKESLLLKLVASGAPAMELTPKGELKRRTPHTLPMPELHEPRPRKSMRLVEWGLLVVVFGLLAVSLWTLTALFRNGRTRREAASAPPPVGLVKLGGPIRITTEPSGAEVFVNGKSVGTTPFEWSDPWHARAEIRLSHEFHHPRILQLDPRLSGNRRMFSVVDGATGRELALLDATQGLSLERLTLYRQKGGLKVQTLNVDDVSVRIDNGLYGSTPFSMEIEAGYHDVRLEKAGYEAYEARIRIDPNSTMTLPVPMLPEGAQAADGRGSARVAFESDPPGATIWINDKEHGTTPTSVELPGGEYQLQVVKKYYESHQQKVLLSLPSTTYLVKLRPLRAAVTFDSEPQGATVVVDGKRLGSTPLTTDYVEGGMHEVVFQLDGYYEPKQSFEVVDTTPVGPISVQLQKVPPGSLTVECDIPGVDVAIDNAPAGPAPVHSRVMNRGKYKVRILGIERIVAVEAGAERTERFTAQDLRLVHVASGEFLFGTRDPMPGQFSTKKENLPSYFIDKYEVTNGQYALFLAYLQESKTPHERCHKDEGKNKDHKPKQWEDPKFNGKDQPVVGVDFWDAYAYARWAGKRLPTEREWEKAARGKNGNQYPWGDSWDPARLNWADFSERRVFQFTSPVGSFPGGTSPYGCLDMAGNVAEWCADNYESTGFDKVVRGGSFRDRDWTTTVIRWREAMNTRGETLGFRCVLDVPQ